MWGVSPMGSVPINSRKACTFHPCNQSTVNIVFVLLLKMLCNIIVSKGYCQAQL